MVVRSITDVERVVAHPWPVPDGLRAAEVWARTVGELTGQGFSRRRGVQPVPAPHLVTRGRGTFRTTRGACAVGPGDMFCLWPGIEHDFIEDPDDPWHFYWIMLGGKEAEGLATAMGFGPKRQTMRPAEPERAIRCFAALFEYYGRREKRDPYRALALLFDLVAACRSAAPIGTGRRSNDRLVEEARALLESLLETGINVAGLAQRLHVTRQALHTAFRTELNLTPVEYLQALRLERAKRLLEATDLKIDAVARAAGYGHEKYFYRRFRCLTGRTPGAWRKEHQHEIEPP